MKLSNLTGGLANFFNGDFGTTITILALTAAGTVGFMDWVEEPINTAPTEKTAQVLIDMRQNITDMTELVHQDKIVEAEKGLTVLRSGKDLEVGSDAWSKYTMEKAKFDALYKIKKDEFTSEILTNSNIPEDKSSDLIREFNAEGFRGLLPSPDDVYGLHEIQAENPDASSYEIYLKNRSNVKDDDASVVIFIPLAVASFFVSMLAGSVTRKLDTAVKSRPEKKSRLKN